MVTTTMATTAMATTATPSTTDDSRSDRVEQVADRTDDPADRFGII